MSKVVWKSPGNAGGVRMAVTVGVMVTVGVRVKVGVRVNVAPGVNVAVAAGGTEGVLAPAQPARRNSIKNKICVCRMVPWLPFGWKNINAVIGIFIHGL